MKNRRKKDEVLELRERMTAARKLLSKGAVSLFVNTYPEYDTYQKGLRVSRVYQLQLVDEDIIAKFEELANNQKTL